MPHYDFECTKCGHCEEKFYQISAVPNTTKCTQPNCNGRMKQKISSTNFVLKGSGWPGKDMREKKSRNKRSDDLSEKMDEKRAAGENVTSLSDLKKKNG